MKKSFLSTLVLLIALVGSTFAQDVKKVHLEQTKGEFTVKEITLSPGDYIFEVANSGVDHAVGFVVAPEGKTDQEHHIKNAYLKKTIKDGEVATSNTVSLEKGTYVYFCPLNPTPQYKITVK